MSTHHNSPLHPRFGSRLRVLIVARISTIHQDPRSLDDQIALCKQHIGGLFQGEIEYIIIRSQDSGEVLDRVEYLAAVDLVEAGRLDIVIVEDLARICRRTHATIFCEACEDVDTRLIAINDSIDTAQEDWRIKAGFASMKHEMSNSDTSKRIRRSLRNRFSGGGVVQCVIWGYEKPPGAKSDAELRLLDAARANYVEWFRRLRDGATYAEIADWLNSLNIPTGPFCRSPRWTDKMVARITHNCILKGWRIRNRNISRRVNKTGRHRSVKADGSELLVRKCPHLAVFSEEEFDDTIRLVDARNAKCRRRPIDGRDPRAGLPRKRSDWPGSHVTCGVCGRLMRYGGHGLTDHLLCRGASEYTCWNSISVDGPLGAQKILVALRDKITVLPDYDDVLLRQIREAVDRRNLDGVQERRDLEIRRARLDKELANLMHAIRQQGHSPTLLAELSGLEGERDALDFQLKALSLNAVPPTQLPSVTEVRQRAFQLFDTIDTKSGEFGRLMRELIPKFVVRPVRDICGGLPSPRAFLTVSLAPLVDRQTASAFGDVLKLHLVVDVLNPPKRIAYRERIEKLRLTGLTQRQIAAELHIDQVDVQKARKLTMRMQEFGLTDPYVVLTEPPADYPKWRRHRHPRYRFEPLEGFDAAE